MALRIPGKKKPAFEAGKTKAAHLKDGRPSLMPGRKRRFGGRTAWRRGRQRAYQAVGSILCFKLA